MKKQLIELGVAALIFSGVASAPVPESATMLLFGTA